MCCRRDRARPASQPAPTIASRGRLSVPNRRVVSPGGIVRLCEWAKTRVEGMNRLADHADQSCLREIVARRRDDPVRSVAVGPGLQPGLGPADQDADVARRRDGGRDPHLGLARASGSLRAEILHRHRVAPWRASRCCSRRRATSASSRFSQARGFDVTELPDRREQTIGGVRSICGVSEFYDSWLHCATAAARSSTERLRRGRRGRVARDRAAHRPIDVLLTQFSYAAWKGGRAERAFPQSSPPRASSK